MNNKQIETPKCFDDREQFLTWVSAARMSGKTVKSYCVDCTPTHQKEMIKKRRCEKPWVVFRKDKDGGLMGFCYKNSKLNYLKGELNEKQKTN